MASVPVSSTIQPSVVAPTTTIPEGIIQDATKISPAPVNKLNIEEVDPPLRVTPLHQLGESPAWIDCPYCRRRAQTRVTKEGSSAQTVMTVLCCLVCICLVCLPMMAGWFANFDHYCTNCNHRVARKLHDGDQTQVFPPQATGGGGFAIPNSSTARSSREEWLKGYAVSSDVEE